jgi:hypothetical protein
MSRQIVIENGIARYQETTVHGEVPLADLVPLLETRLTTVFPILPDHTRLVAINPNTGKGVVVVETTPFRSFITLHASRNDGYLQDEDKERIDKNNIATWNLQFPFQYHVYEFTVKTDENKKQLTDFTLTEGKLFWRPDKFTKLTDGFWPALLFNIETNARICWGYTQAETASLAQRIDDQVKSFQATIFNTHLAARSPFGTYTEWERDSNSPANYKKWAMFTKPVHVTGESLASEFLAEGFMTESTNSSSIIPEPPPSFTIAKASEWLRDRDPQARKIFTIGFLKQAIEDGILDPQEFTIAKALASPKPAKTSIEAALASATIKTTAGKKADNG